MMRNMLYRISFLSLAVLFYPAAVYPLSLEEEGNIRIYEEMNPGVVNIINTTVSYDFFFNPVPEKGAGSGSIIDRKGYILTNYHVVEGAQRIEVTLFDGSKWEARIIGADPGNDIAIIKIGAPPDKLKVIPFGDSGNLRVGQKVLVIGNPFGLEGTLTVGIISSLGRTMRAIDGRLVRGVVQTDAVINPGNSGGPLLDGGGRMIGVNSAIFSPSGTNVGIGFAIPVNIVKRIVPQLMEKGRVPRPWLGIGGQDIGIEVARILKIPSEGVLIAEVISGSPAERGGLRGGKRIVDIGNLEIVVGGDMVTAVNAKTVKRMDELLEEIESMAIGQTVALSILRDGKKMTIKVTLTEMPYEE